MKKELAAIVLSQGASNTLDLTLNFLRNKAVDVIGLPEEYNSADFSLKKSPFVKLSTKTVTVTKSGRAIITATQENINFLILKYTQDNFYSSQQIIRGLEIDLQRVFTNVPDIGSEWDVSGDMAEFLSSAFHIHKENDQLYKVRLKITLADRSYSGTIKTSTIDVEVTNGIGSYDFLIPGETTDGDVTIYDIVESIAFTPLDSNDAYIAGGATIADEEITCQSEDVEIFSVTESAE